MNIENLYRKFKSYIYYDRTSLHNKELIAKYELSTDFEENLANLDGLINRIFENNTTSDDENVFEEWLDDINVYIIPKSFSDNNDIQSQDNSINNNVLNKNIKIDKFNYLFKGPLELHIISFYWVLRYAKYLENIYGEYNYANKLVNNDQENEYTQQTFRPYFKDYAMWRDNGILKAQELFANNEGCSILMLDISSYYYNIDFNFSNLEEFFLEHLDEYEYQEYLNLSSFIIRIFSKYNEILRKYNSIVEEDQLSLPLGLSISPILANYYLHEFDIEVNSLIKPVYYGRYVDDILIVLNENSFKYLDKGVKKTTEFITKNFIDNFNIFTLENKEYVINDSNFKIDYANRIVIQSSKIKLYILESEGTPAVLDKFVENIKKNSSEFRFIPEETKVITEFYNEAYSMLYNDTQNKLRSIEKFEGDKFGVSKYLAKIILTSKYWNDDQASLNKLVDQVDNFFIGRHSIEYFSLWEKIFSFYLINQRYDKMLMFYNRININIDSIKVGKNNLNKKGALKKYLKSYCDLAIANAGALNYAMFDHIGDELNSKIKNDSYAIRNANMFNHTYLIMPLVNYNNGSDKIKNLLDLNLRCSKDMISGRESCQKCSQCELEIDFDSNRIKYCPRFIHLHEIQHYTAYCEAYKYSKGVYGNYLMESVDIFAKINRLNPEKMLKPTFIDSESNPHIININIPQSGKFDSLKVGVASMKVESLNIEKSYLKRPNLSRERLNRITRLLNYIERTNSDIVVLPEVSIPFAWLGIFTEYAQKRQKTLVFGLEHIINRNCVAMNLLTTIIPFKTKSTNCCNLRLRLKNYYSPEEKRLLEGYRYIVPQNRESVYDLFNWNGVRFSCFNCFELADIGDRAYFKNKVDFLTASEYNRDTNYFSNIVESVSRDVHCYFVQSNSSDFGDSRIVSPSKSYKMDIVRLKGGINDQVVVGEINLKKLREFQYKEFELQKEDDSFKPTPPNFDKDEIERILAE